MPNKGAFPIKFFGYDKKQVEAALQEKEALTALKAETLQELLLQRKALAGDLKRELAELQKQVTAKAQEKELLDFARLRAKEAVLLLEKEAENQIEHLMNEAKLKKENEQKHISEIENEIKQAKDYIETLLDSVVRVLTNSSNSSFEEFLPDKVVARITPGRVFPGKISPPPNQDKEHRAREKDNAAEAENNLEERMTADGAVAPTFDRQYQQFVATISQAMTASQNLELAATAEKKEAPPTENGFWEEAEALPPAEAQQAELREEGPKNSPVLSREINNIRYKYIVGKIAGADLLDGQGQLIISKGLTITNEHVNLAEAEGKLAELILNMNLPGLE